MSQTANNMADNSVEDRRKRVVKAVFKAKETAGAVNKTIVAVEFKCKSAI